MNSFLCTIFKNNICAIITMIGKVIKVLSIKIIIKSFIETGIFRSY